MTNPMLSINELLAIRHKIKTEKPLIHAITNPISINDCANIVLATGAKPIMAEHPCEVSEITAAAKALAVNLGNITDVRMESMLLSGRTALINHIPSIIDIVGVGCSTLRLNYAKKFIAECRPNIIKGNMSELKALYGVESDALGIDAGESDVITVDTLSNNAALLTAFAAKTGSVILATSVIDIITDGTNTYLIKNGCAMLSLITGTGCMLNVLTASFISSKNIIGGTVLGAALMGISGELAQTEKGTGTFRTGLLDCLSSITDDSIKERIKYTMM
ncbi:MAG: hydroxyethylthiazole kinase [Pelosinus sp.]|nr:hydroxyethylthiazole kinase [Pelosinus sp.]